MWFAAALREYKEGEKGAVEKISISIFGLGDTYTKIYVGNIL